MATCRLAIFVHWLRETENKPKKCVQSVYDLKVMCNLLVTTLIIAFSLIVSGNVELNPGPMPEKMFEVGKDDAY